MDRHPTRFVRSFCLNSPLPHPLLESLNGQQREAVLALDGPVLVVAGPGTGKTKTLTVHLAYLLIHAQIAPEALLAMTFTTRAARDMRERLEQLVGDRAQRVVLGTFHRFCLQLLRVEGSRLDLPQDFGVADHGNQVTIMQQVLRQIGMPDHRTMANRTVHNLSSRRNQKTDFMTLLEQDGLHEVYQVYQRRLHKQGLVDFDDLLIRSAELLERFPDIQRRLQQHYAFIVVDEYQDVNPVQHRLLQLLAGHHGNLWAVGDIDQAIYAFRGAESEHVLQFEKHYPTGRVFRLETSYRFTPQIAAAASQVIENNVARLTFALKTDQPQGLPIQVISFHDEEAEAAWVIRQIEERVGGTSHYQHNARQVTDTVSQRERSFQDFAVLSRLHALTRPLQEAFTQSGIPFRVVGETRFFDKTVIKDVLSYLRVIQNPHDASLIRIINCPPRGIGTQTQLALNNQAEQQGLSLYATLGRSTTLSPSQVEVTTRLVKLIEQLQGSLKERSFSQFLTHVADVTGLRQWRVEQNPCHDNDLMLLCALAAQYDEMATTVALQKFLEETRLTVEADDYDASIDAVTLMTIHAAKGLEFTEVILCGVEEGSLPYEHGDLEEERRLFYVGLTRAREQVHLLHCRSRFLFGERRDRKPSRFQADFEGRGRYA